MENESEKNVFKATEYVSGLVKDVAVRKEPSTATKWDDHSRGKPHRNSAVWLFNEDSYLPIPYKCLDFCLQLELSSTTY